MFAAIYAVVFRKLDLSPPPPPHNIWVPYLHQLTTTLHELCVVRIAGSVCVTGPTLA